MGDPLLNKLRQPPIGFPQLRQKFPSRLNVTFHCTTTYSEPANPSRRSYSRFLSTTASSGNEYLAGERCPLSDRLGITRSCGLCPSPKLTRRHYRCAGWQRLVKSEQLWGDRHKAAESTAPQIFLFRKSICLTQEKRYRKLQDTYLRIRSADCVNCYPSAFTKRI